MSRRVEEYRLRMHSNLAKVDETIQKPGSRFRLALAVRSMNHGDFQIEKKEAEVRLCWLRLS